MELKPCPFCGGEAKLFNTCLTLPYVCGCLSCRAEGPGSKEDVGAVELWNRRCEAAPPPTAPLTLEELREMDGEPVWIVESPEWGHWELSEDAEDYFMDREEAFYGMTYEGPGTRCGLHPLGWLAYRRKPEEGTKWQP